MYACIACVIEYDTIPFVHYSHIHIYYYISMYMYILNNNSFFLLFIFSPLFYAVVVQNTTYALLLEHPLSNLV